MAVNMESTLKEVLADPEAVKIVEKYSPGFSANPQLKMALGMKLSNCVKFPQAKMNKQQIEELTVELNAYGAK